jgi:hypothetical protein
MNEDFVPFELAKKLKEKGFNEPCYGYYHCNGGNESFELCGNGNRDFLNSKNKHRIAAPTIPQVLKWLREEQKLHIEVMFIRPLRNRVKYYITDTDGSRGDFMDVADEHYETWEQATLAGIEYVLDNLI